MAPCKFSHIHLAPLSVADVESELAVGLCHDQASLALIVTHRRRNKLA